MDSCSLFHEMCVTNTNFFETLTFARDTSEAINFNRFLHIHYDHWHQFLHVQGEQIPIQCIESVIDVNKCINFTVAQFASDKCQTKRIARI